MPTRGRPGARIRIDPELWKRYAVVARAAGHPDRSAAVRQFIEKQVREYDKARHEERLWTTGDPIA
jgi:metal-responsive CopG/Arc/MetJ family transcriptional regulator